MHRMLRESLAVAALMLWAVAACPAAGPQTLTPLPERPPAAQFALEDMDGKTLRLAALRGKVVLINFWATWCPPCRREMPSLERLHRLMKAEGLAVLAINVGEEPDTVFSFTGTLDASPGFPILFDRDSAVLRAYPVKGLPTSFVLDRDGRIAYRAVGGRDFDDPAIVATLRQLLREGARSVRQ